MRRSGAGKDDIAAIFGANLKAARAKMGLTQCQLAEHSGLRQQYVSLVEAGNLNITFNIVQALATAVNLDVRTLLTPRRARKS